jgi:predicted RNase H-like HicB family nuclease
MTTINLVIHHDEGTWWAESPDLEGFTVVAASLAELRVTARDAVTFHLDADHPIDVRESLSDDAATDVGRNSAETGTHG